MLDTLGRDQLDLVREVVHVDDQQVAHRVVRGATPVRSPARERIEQRPLLRRRREQTIGHGVRNPRTAAQPVEQRQPERVARRQAVRHDGRRHDRERLRRREPFAGSARLRNRPLLHGQERLSRVAVQDEHEARLRHLRHHVMQRAVTPHRVQTRLRWHVVVPDVVVHGLETPAHLPRRGLQRDHRVRVAVVARSQTAKEIRTGAAGRNEHEPAFLVHRHRRPGVGVAFRGWLRALPGRRRRILSHTRNRIPLPARRTGPGIKSPHRTHRRHHPGVIPNRRTNHHCVSNGDGRRRDLELPRPQQRHPRIDADLAVHSEPKAAAARRRVQGDQTRIVRAHEYPLGTYPRRVRIAPMGHAATDELVRGILAEVDTEIEAPPLGTTARIEGDDLVEGRAEDEGVVHEDRGALRGRLIHVIRTRGHVARPVLPNRGEAGHVGCGDLVCLTVAVAARVSAVVGPVLTHVDGVWGAGRFGCCAGDVETVRPSEEPDHRATEDRREGQSSHEGRHGQDDLAGVGHRASVGD